MAGGAVEQWDSEGRRHDVLGTFLTLWISHDPQTLHLFQQIVWDREALTSTGHQTLISVFFLRTLDQIGDF